jgi:hypothetical protein
MEIIDVFLLGSPFTINSAAGTNDMIQALKVTNDILYLPK